MSIYNLCLYTTRDILHHTQKSKFSGIPASRCHFLLLPKVNYLPNEAETAKLHLAPAKSKP